MSSNGHVVTLTDAEAFFFEHAGYSHDPARETRTSGRTRGAIRLAMAKEIADERGWKVRWSIDHDADITPGENYFVSGAQHWQACLVNNVGEILASLGSIDLGYSVRPIPAWPESVPYARVVEAELAYGALREGY
jgi:hypothetical protein